MDAAFGHRVTERLRALGYWKDGRPDIGRFSTEKGYIPSYVYRWRAGEVPRGVMLFRLAADLGLSAEALLLGAPDGDGDGESPARRRRPTMPAGPAGAKAPPRARTPQVGRRAAAARHNHDAMPLIRRIAARAHNYVGSVRAATQAA